MITLVVFLVTLFGFIFTGLPLAFCLGISGLVLSLMSGYYEPFLFARRMVAGINNFTLMAIPFFMLAGEIMNRSGVTKDLLRFANALVGHLRGGLAYVNVLASMLFAGCTGSAVADTSALGSLEIPMMVDAGYDRPFSCAITAASAVIGPIIPPSIPMIIVGMIAGLPVGKLFLAGAIPGLLIGGILIGISYFISRKRQYPKGERASLKEVLYSFARSIFALMLPVIILGGIIFGVFTPTEAGCVAAIYALIIGIFFYKLKITELPDIFLRAGITSSIVMFICSTATIVTWLLTANLIPIILTDFIGSITSNPYIVLLICNVLLLLVGTVIDLVPALFIFVPVLFPMVKNFGIDPIFFGAVMVTNLCIGLLTPPVGTVLYVTVAIGKINLETLAKALFPMLIGLIVVLLLITYFPSLIVFLPNLIK